MDTVLSVGGRWGGSMCDDYGASGSYHAYVHGRGYDRDYYYGSPVASYLEAQYDGYRFVLALSISIGQALGFKYYGSKPLSLEEYGCTIIIGVSIDTWIWESFGREYSYTDTSSVIEEYDEPQTIPIRR
jgi:hypothetical protein